MCGGRSPMVRRRRPGAALRAWRPFFSRPASTRRLPEAVPSGALDALAIVFKMFFYSLWLSLHAPGSLSLCVVTGADSRPGPGTRQLMEPASPAPAGPAVRCASVSVSRIGVLTAALVRRGKPHNLQVF